MASQIDLCNEALSEIGADTIASLDEPSVAAKECRRFFASVVADMLELHDWGFNVARVVLAAIPNDRPTEWLAAYAKPADCASLLRVLPYQEGSTEPLYAAWPLWAQAQTGWQGTFIEDSGVIYTGLSPAVLEYTRSTVTVDQMPALFRRAVVYELASRLAIPVKKDRQLKGDTVQLAAAARADAMADDMNRYPRRQREYPDPVSIVREGGFPLCR